MRRILLFHSVTLSIGGIPLIHLSDEACTLNDYPYPNILAKSEDSCWVYRPTADWQQRAHS